MYAMAYDMICHTTHLPGKGFKELDGTETSVRMLHAG